jgi:4-hydroxy-3-methylbut-2-en-1-yl diphosphate reductase
VIFFALKLCNAKPMNIIKAEHLGMCFGVRDAIALAEAAAKEAPLTILGELAHNPAVNARLERHGIQIQENPAQVATRQVMITAHGASQKRIDAIRAQGLEVFEGTCPLVHHAHRAVAQLINEGYYPVIIGKRDHVEVRGLTEDLIECSVIEREEQISEIPKRPRIGIASQTTQPIDRVQHLASRIRARFPDSEVKFVDTVCQPTKQRQRAAQDLAAKSDVVIVIGGANSNNTRELVRTCAKFGATVHHVQGPGDLRAEWFARANVVGITAGTSTPDEVIAEVEAAVRRFA